MTQPAENGFDAQLPAVSVVIVNYNTGGFLVSTIESVLQQDGVSAEIIVIDNASSDDSLSALDALDFGDVSIDIVRLKRNFGYAYGCNIGQSRARGRYVLFLNPDCLLTPDSLVAMSDFLDREPDAGIVGPLIRGPDGKEQSGCRRDIPTPFQVACALVGVHRLLKNHPRFRHFNHTGRELPSEPIKVHAVSGACMMVPRTLLDELGAFDEAFFLHFEDVDICLRFFKADRHAYFLPQIEVHHFKGVSSRSRPFMVHWSKHRSLIRFLRKHFFEFYPASFMLLLNFSILIHFMFTWPMVLLQQRSTRKDSGWDIVVSG